MKRVLTQEQAAKAAERKAAFRALAGKISAMSADERSAFAVRMPVVTVEGRSLSPFNACMVASQCPSATVVGGFRQWLAAGRCVRKGEHGLALWIPCGAPKADDATDEAPDVHFILGTVFDVSQTDVVNEEQHAKSAERAALEAQPHTGGYIEPEFRELARAA